MANIAGTFRGITVQFELPDEQAETWFTNFCIEKNIDLPVEGEEDYDIRLTIAINAMLWEVGHYIAEVARSRAVNIAAEMAREQAYNDSVWDTSIPTRPDNM